MVKAGKWLRNFLTGKKEKNQGRLMERKIWFKLPPPPPPPPPTTPEGESMRSLQLETVLKHTSKGQFSPPSFFFKPEIAKAAARKSSFSTIQQVAAIKIQACFRSFLARKALRALKGLVKLQAVVRGFLVRKKAAATLRGMQALLTVQVRARAHRVRMIEEVHSMQRKETNQRRMINESKFQQSYDMERDAYKMMEKGLRQQNANSKNKKGNPTAQTQTKDRRQLFNYLKPSLTPSTVSGMCSGNREETETFFTTRNSSQNSSPTPRTRRISSSEGNSNQEESYLISQEFPFFPNYMANTKSWKAKSRSQSAPRQRNDLFDSKLSGKQRISVDGRNISRAGWASPMSSMAAKEQIPWSEEIDRLMSNIDYYKFIAD
ncbi:hypothetical protein KFK09_002368 [Dendrobium nobile]|uniref:DUF4005 domain-containing protein n=1 Tax=Dendrobium nobile TaxID=94219 RepID=A0A8T3C147_DENNO|nr:hypothetical protein KFK09_002368 [Dendrobium nobile]